jgi:predicted NUDIX family NTP pyrophosphohydrolase
MKKSNRVSAGLLMFRRTTGRLEVFIAHPGGPFFAHRDEGHWTIPKGEIAEGEELLATAIREFSEETGLTARGPFLPLGSIRQKGGKTVHAWAFEGDHEASQPLRSNTFELEYPLGSGRIVEFPEIDRAEFFPVADARRKLKETQVPFLERLEQALGAG